MRINDKFFAFFIHRTVSRGKYNIAKSRKSRKDGVTWQLLARLDNRLLLYKEKRTSYLGLFVCAVRFNLDLANVCNSKLTQKTMKNNCRVRNESSSSLSDFLDLFLLRWLSIISAVFLRRMKSIPWILFVCFTNVKEIHVPYYHCAWFGYPTNPPSYQSNGLLHQIIFKL